MEPIFWSVVLFLLMVFVHELNTKKTVTRSTAALHDIHRESEKLVCRIVPGQKRSGDVGKAI